MSTASHHLSAWKLRHAVVTIIGIALNLALVLPFLICPGWVMGQLSIPVSDFLWPRWAAGLMIIIALFYVPMIWNFDRYRVFAWMAIFPCRFFGAIFFISAVVIFGEPASFLIFGLADAVIAFAWLVCMIRIMTLEQAIMDGSA